jgi:hypothetical protein
VGETRNCLRVKSTVAVVVADYASQAITLLLSPGGNSDSVVKDPASQVLAANEVLKATGRSLTVKLDLGLLGLKENIIIGKLIPAGTGMPRYRECDLTAPEYEPMAFYTSDEADPAEWLASMTGTTYNDDNDDTVARLTPPAVQGPPPTRVRRPFIGGAPSQNGETSSFCCAGLVGVSGYVDGLITRSGKFRKRERCHRNVPRVHGPDTAGSHDVECYSLHVVLRLSDERDRPFGHVEVELSQDACCINVSASTGTNKRARYLDRCPRTGDDGTVGIVYQLDGLGMMGISHQVVPHDNRRIDIGNSHPMSSIRPRSKSRSSSAEARMPESSRSTSSLDVTTTLGPRGGRARMPNATARARARSRADPRSTSADESRISFARALMLRPSRRARAARRWCISSGTRSSSCLIPPRSQ